MKRRTLLTALLLAPTTLAATRGTAAAPASGLSRAEIARNASALLTANYPAEGPGAAALAAQGDSVLFRAARGQADVAAHTPLRPGSVFRIGSVTKQFTAAGLLKLVEAGRLGLEDPVSKHLPGFHGGETITLLQLLNHTSGLRDYTSLPGYMDGPIRNDLTTAQLLDLFKSEPPEFAPGAGWAYCNSGYILLGAVIEAVTGLSWHAWLDRVLFRPLGLSHTGYGHDPKFAALQTPGYTYDDTGAVRPMRLLSMTQPHAAGALVSNVDDLHRWNRALHGGRVLGPALYRRMTTPEGRAAAPGIGYGFGLFTGSVRGHAMLQHGGHIFGFVSALSYLPGPGVSVVVLENDDARNSPDDADVLARKLSAITLGQPYPALRPISVDPAVLTAAEGVYRFDGGIVRVLRIVDGQLTAQRGDGPRAALAPIAEDDFLYADGFNRLTLERGPAGAITAMRFFANGDGPGVLGVRTREPLPAPPAGLQLPRAALERLTGAYANGPMVLKVFLDGDALRAQLAGQPPVGLRATTPTHFDVEETGATLDFTPGNAPAAEAVMRQGGREMALKRMP